ncbi:glycerol-3-phosphate dehydrogenase [NAD(+)], cytoplasmic-like [Limulus polyphemus]|uniref:Glycerol-3-phosphate dehydrogenase [NAD(+)] n=1 Tax=Limulus polyphemus TaxID=6850 RepID=A0ABM1SVS1_LIMPO|nr:glycerol-3-phosphate dehydrogenase [NAD(+)], cytoplasmic-like [Limulus polyphemus]XP_022247705.1 glycerol-3-phosphate dehydrogenase [NAD(+)], cytoplasmic-like [Limulus polyphemus]XP_022247712.1 glycerol-3-phosphate dehydrogenase [NAD(+)], cytoplasmic-like [Limulus polyphemus]XP_022247719.1 glycerol-3-phosphate dehydrogenase [NAD(+)], cytoplasmic-like [Limulus polyphemus]XP_022247724.1 glycerol-3-phosphate dehydrogenase [NAD(+)], cytoplasmic-like [Limulus polyphemus]XP_022247727.1 glycerol-3
MAVCIKSIRSFSQAIRKSLHLGIRENTKLKNWGLKHEKTLLQSISNKKTKFYKLAVIGSGSWASAIARIVGHNARHNDLFDETVMMYVRQRIFKGEKLTDIINSQHENPCYLPGFKLPDNIFAVSDVVEAARNSDIIIFVMPHKFVKQTCTPLIGQIKPYSIGVSLIKSFDVDDSGEIRLVSDWLRKNLNIDVSVLMGANIAHEVAAEFLCEATLGTYDEQVGNILKQLFETDYFKVTMSTDLSTIELCGALKNIVALASGCVDGLGYGNNTKAAVIRLGLTEMIKFAQWFYPKAKLETFFQSCGVADLLTTCYGGRNRRLAEAFVRTRQKLNELEAEMLEGQKLQGPETADAVHRVLKKQNLEEHFPLFVVVNKIFTGQLPPTELITCVRHHPQFRNLV